MSDRSRVTYSIDSSVGIEVTLTLSALAIEKITNISLNMTRHPTVAKASLSIHDDQNHHEGESVRLIETRTKFRLTLANNFSMSHRLIDPAWRLLAIETICRLTTTSGHHETCLSEQRKQGTVVRCKGWSKETRQNCKRTAPSRIRNMDLRMTCIAAIPRSTTELRKLISLVGDDLAC